MKRLTSDQKANLCAKRLPSLKKIISSCKLCPRQCGSRRLMGETGECGLTGNLFVSQSFLHRGEEPVLSGDRGSGTVFFSSCNLKCNFCQNYDISQLRHGQTMSVETLANTFLSLEKKGAHNINLVTPTHQVYGIMRALQIAWENGLDLPVVYNCGGYEGLEVIKLLEDLVDIYLTDFKYGSDQAGILSGVSDYFTHTSSAVEEMYRQAGSLKIVGKIAVSGLMIRHLVLPENLSDSIKMLDWLSENLDNNVYLCLMSQYHPEWKAHNIPELDRRLTRNEYLEVHKHKMKKGFISGWEQSAPLF